LAEAWEKVVVKLRSRSMPPPGLRRPENGAYDTVASWLEQELDRAAAARPNPGRPADLHRLNRAEYANAIRDLLSIEIDPAAMLPPDTQAHGFDTNADALSMEPALLDRYLTAAAKIARIAVGDPTLTPSVERYTAVKGNANEQTWLWQTERLGEDFPLGSRGGIAARHYFPVDGEYDLRVRLARTYADVIRGLQVPNEIELRVDGVRVGQFAIGGPEFTADSQDADEPLHVRVPLKAGLRQVVATIVRVDGGKAEGLGPDRIPIWNRDSDVPAFPLFISSLLTLTLKVILLPYILYALIQKLDIKKEIETLVNIPGTMLIGIALVIFSYHLTAPITRLSTLVTRSTLAVALATVMLGLLMMVTRRHAVTQIIGFLAMENGLFFAATSATYGMPMVVELGVALDLLIAAFIFGIFFFHISTTFDTLDVAQMAKLKEEE
jgi:hydrogenase-4 component E